MQIALRLWGSTQLNEVKPRRVLRFFKGNFSSELEKNPDANSTGEFDTINREDSLINEMNIGGRDCNVRIEESF